MDATRIETLVRSHGLAIDDWHGGAGRFRDLYVGTGHDASRLRDLQRALVRENVRSVLTHVANPDHPHRGKPFLEIPSFWWEPAD